MSFMELIMLFVLFLTLVFIAAGVIIYRKKPSMMRKPTLIGISALVLQILLILSLFFNKALVNVDEKIFNVVWWGIVLYGFIIGIKEVKNNILVSLLSIFLSILLTIYMALGLFIISM
ncbi:hypothetical protein GCM10028778_20330 [Barrientosiimonas marina]|uniref:Uncharacterized protein n=1 Tax=Lentibacillus kimchii TaxID=1542911 RepID=A0ABW2UY25_9BACI